VECSFYSAFDVNGNSIHVHNGRANDGARPLHVRKGERETICRPFYDQFNCGFFCNRHGVTGLVQRIIDCNGIIFFAAGYPDGELV
jgi:hypothetical protein